MYSSNFDKDSTIENDICFIGLAKNRLDDIYRAFEILRSNNYKCDFHLVGVKKNERRYLDEIHYSKNISYMKNLEYISKSKSILEIMQKRGYGHTLRMCEAVMFDKILITNNTEVQKLPFYDPDKIVSISNVSKIDKKETIKPIKYDKEYKDDLSPIRFLSDIKERIIKDNED